MKSFKQFLFEGKVKAAMMDGTYKTTTTPIKKQYTFLFYYDRQYYHGDTSAVSPAKAKVNLFNRLCSLLGRNAIGVDMKSTSPQQIQKGSQPRSSKEIP